MPRKISLKQAHDKKYMASFFLSVGFSEGEKLLSSLNSAFEEAKKEHEIIKLLVEEAVSKNNDIKSRLDQLTKLKKAMNNCLDNGFNRSDIEREFRISFEQLDISISQMKHQYSLVDLGEYGSYRYIYQEQGEICAWSGRGRPPHALRELFDKNGEEMYLAVLDANIPLLIKYLILNISVKKQSIRPEVPYQYVYIEGGKIKAWKGRGIAPKFLKEIKANALTTGDMTELNRYLIDYSDKNAQLFKAFCEENNISTELAVKVA